MEISSNGVFCGPVSTKYFGVKTGEPGDEPLNIEELMKDREPVWDEIYGLKGASSSLLP